MACCSGKTRFVGRGNILYRLIVVLGKKKRERELLIPGRNHSANVMNLIPERKPKKFDHESFSLLCLLVAEVDQQILI